LRNTIYSVGRKKSNIETRPPLIAYLDLDKKVSILKGDCKYQISQKIQKNKKSGSILKYKMKLFPIPLNPPLNGKYSIPIHDKIKGGLALNKVG
jgi:hypothetical protein